MASIASRRRVPLSWRFAEWRENVEFSPRTKRIAGIAGLGAFGLVWGALVGLAGLPAAILCVAAFSCVFVMRDFRVGALLMIAIMPISQSQIFPRAMFGVLNTVLYFPSGAVYPQQGFPGCMQVIAKVDPFTYAVHAFKNLLLKNTGWEAIAYDIGYLLVFSAVAMTAATLLFKRTL